MAHTSEPVPVRAPRRGRWAKILGIIAGIVVVLLVFLYFVGTSSAFIKSFVLPKVGDSMGAEVTASAVDLSPFSQVIIRDLKVTPKGAETLLSAKDVTVKYKLRSIMRGNMEIDDIVVSSPIVTIVQKPDGSMNIDPVLKAQEESGESTPTADDEPARMLLRQLTLTDGRLSYFKQYGGGKEDITELSQFSMSVSNLGNGATGKASARGLMSLQNNPPAPGTSGALKANLDGDYDFTLDQELMPAIVKGASKLRVTSASGGLAQMSGFSLDMKADVRTNEIREASILLSQNGSSLGALSASGPFSLQTLEGKLNARLTGVDSKAFNMAGAAMGIDFGSSSLESTNQLEIARTGQVVTIHGTADLSRFQAIITNNATPTLDLSAAYDLTVDMEGSLATIRTFNIHGRQQDREILKGQLTAPMVVSWGATSNAAPDSAWNLVLTGLNLADWRAFTGDTAPEGVVSGEVKLASHQAGRVLKFDATSQIQNLALLAGSNSLRQLEIAASASGTATNLEHFNLPQLDFRMGPSARPMVALKGTGLYNQTTAAADFSVSGSAALDKLVALFPQPGTALTAGVAEFRARLTQNSPANQTNASKVFWSGATNSSGLVTRTVTGAISATNVTGMLSSNRVEGFAASAEVDVVADGNLMQLRKLAGSLFGSGRPGGSFDITGSYAPTNGATRLVANIIGLNENGLRPMLQPLLAGKELVSVLINGNANILYQPEGSSAIRSDFVVTNLVVYESGKPLSPEPLSMGMVVDATILKDIVDIRDARLALTPTQRATNVVTLTGRLDTSDTNFTEGSLKLSAPALDLTRYYDVFTSTQAVASASSAPGPSSSSGRSSPQPGPAPEIEAEPITLPLSNFVFQADAGSIFLREMVISNLHSSLKIDGGKVRVEPLRLTLNGGSVNGGMDLDLAQPGFRYSFKFGGSQIPLAPLVNTFQPERRGQMAGTLTGQMQLAGAGTTSSNLYKNLKGSFDFGTTNLNLAIPSLRSPLMKTIVNVIAVVPEIARNPNAALGLLGGALGGRQSGTAGGLADEIMQSPVDVVRGKLSIGNSRVDIQDSLIQSPAFQATARGSVGLTPIVTNSVLNVPLSVALKRSLAANLNMVPAGTPTNVIYVRIPDYVTIKGTVGEPKPDINKMALVGTALQQIGSSIPGVDEKTGGILRNIGGVLTGSTTTNTTSGTNQPRQGNLLQGLGSILSGGQTNQPANESTNRQSRTERTLQGLGGLLNALGTNQASSGGTNSATVTNQNPVGSLLDQLLSPKK